jgi:hypothetical protein
MSSFSWLDYAESDRRAAMDVIDLFREQDTVDELGIGSVRDTFSDLLFPGTSAIQTRARYFFIIPWIYQRIERARVESSLAADKARRDELALIEVLEESDDTIGIIGVRARKSLKRLPSMVYWQGLGRLAIKTYAGTRDQYHRSLDAFYARISGTIRNDDGEVLEYGKTRNWDRLLPPPPAGFPRTCSLTLAKREAEYLGDRIRNAAPQSLFAFLVDLPVDVGDVDFPWEHPAAETFPTAAATVVSHAQNFSEALHGATLLYNLILAELLKRQEWIDGYESDLEVWAAGITERKQQFADWDLAEFWQIVIGSNGRVPIPTRAFVDSWLAFVRSPRLSTVSRDSVARDLVSNRERMLKRGLARVDGGRALELFQGAAGTRQIDYRWTATVRQMLSDIQEGLASGNA